VPRSVFEVAPFDGQWKVSRRGQGVVSTHATKELAFEDGRRAARLSQPSHLMIMNADGTIETELIYGDEPIPPRV
jgi:hypothetical protein